MKTSKITNIENNTYNQQLRKRKIAESTAILLGTTAISPAAFLIVDNFSSNKKNYIKSVENEKNIFRQTVEKQINIGLDILKKRGIFIDELCKKYTRKMVETNEQIRLDEKLELLKETRKSHINNGVKISTGIGLSLGSIILALRSLSKKTNTNVIQTINDNPNYFNLQPDKNLFFNDKKNNEPSFTGIVDKIADELNSEQLKYYQDYVNGEKPTKEETIFARNIADHRVKDWPKDLIYYSEYLKPHTDEEYHNLLLKQEVIVPELPPMYFRNYDKWFNTQRWKDYQKWPEYIKKAALFERMESLISIERIRSYKSEEAQILENTRKNLAMTCIKYKINDEFLSVLNSGDPKAKIPDAVMIQGKNDKDTQEIIKWIIGKANSNYTFIKDKNENNDIRLSQILTVLEQNAQTYQKDKKSSIVWVENFDKLLTDNGNNEEVIGDIKDMLDKISKDYKTTILFNCSDTKDLNPIALQPHRVKIYNIDKKQSFEELKEIQKGYILSNIQKLKNNDGYRLNYLPTDNRYVDLYLGDFAYSKDILWADSQNINAVKAVLENLDAIKEIPMFKNIKRVKFPKPDKIDELKDKNLICTGNITIDGKVIYEYKI